MENKDKRNSRIEANIFEEQYREQIEAARAMMDKLGELNTNPEIQFYSQQEPDKSLIGELSRSAAFLEKTVSFGNGSLNVVQNIHQQWGVNDDEGNVVIPMGEYDWIDGFNRGYARVRRGDLWGIVSDAGELVVPVEYDEIWRLQEGYDTMVMYKNANYDHSSPKVYGRSPKPGSLLFNVETGEIYPYVKHSHFYDYDDYEDEYGSHFGDFAGSYAQDDMGYSDDVIYDAFEGDPDAYWNID